MEGHGRSRKVNQGHGSSFPITRFTFQVRKVMCGGVGGVWWPEGLSVSPSPSPFPLDFGFGIWDLDLGLDLGLTILIIIAN